MRNIFLSISLFLSMVVFQNTGYSNPVENEQQQVEETYHVIRQCDKNSTECIIITINDLNGLKPLIENGADVNLQDYKHTHFMDIFYYDSGVETVKVLLIDDDTEIVILLKAGANINLQDKDDYTHSFYSLDEIDTETVILLEEGADVLIKK